jgi:hypothetical protein
MDRGAETRIEMLTLGVLVVILALFLVGKVEEPLAMTLAGVVLLGSGFYQSSKGWHVAVSSWLLGVVLLLAGIGVRMFLVAYVNINWVAIALVAIGALIIWENVFNRRS